MQSPINNQLLETQAKKLAAILKMGIQLQLAEDGITFLYWPYVKQLLWNNLERAERAFYCSLNNGFSELVKALLEIVNPALIQKNVLDMAVESENMETIGILLKDSRLKPNVQFYNTICLASQTEHGNEVRKIFADPALNPVIKAFLVIKCAELNLVQEIKLLLSDSKVIPAIQSKPELVEAYTRATNWAALCNQYDTLERLVLLDGLLHPFINFVLVMLNSRDSAKNRMEQRVHKQYMEKSLMFFRESTLPTEVKERVIGDLAFLAFTKNS